MLETTRTQALSAPAAVAAALWVEAWLGGRVGADDLLTVMSRVAPDTPAALQNAGQSHPVRDLLQRVRAAEVTHAWPLLPRPGRTVGWPAIGAGGAPRPAVLLVARGVTSDELPLQARLLLRAARGGWMLDDLTGPSGSGGPVARTAGGPAGPDRAADPVAALTAEALTPRAASRRFDELLHQASSDLARLGLERAPTYPDAHRWADALGDPPPDIDGPVAALLHRAARILDALDLALRDDGAAVTAGEAQIRSARLRGLSGELADLVAALTVGASLQP